MRIAYPIILTKTEEGFLVTIPDFHMNTQGVDEADAIFMARDAIGLMGMDMEDEKKELPVPSHVDTVKKEDGDIVTLVDVDFTAYRRMHDNRTVRKNLTIPSWLNEEAKKEGINFSLVLKNALMEQLNVRR